MKIAITADLHAHDYTSFARTLPDGMNSRLKRCLDALEQLFNYCRKNTIPNIWFLGDLFHARSKIDIAVYTAVYELLKIWREQGREKILMAVGNHDQYLKDGSINSSIPLIELIRAWDIPGFIDSGDRKFGISILPYMTSAEQIRTVIDTYFLKQYPEGMKKILLAHLPISGAKVGSGFHPREEATLEDIQAEEWDLVLLGHYHRRQRLADNVWYVGAPIQQDFGDEGNPDGFMVLDTETLELEAVPIVSERFVTVKSMGEVGDHPGGYFVRLEGKEKGEAGENVHGLVCTSPEVPSFAPRIKLSGKMTMEEMMAKYVDHLGPELDRDRLMEVGKELVKGEDR